MHEAYTPLGWLIGSAVSLHPGLRDGFRSRHFKGKTFITRFVRDPAPAGEYDCNGATFAIDFGDQIQRAIYYGIYERHELAFLRGLARPGWTCVDIGANVGFFTVHLAKAVGPEGRVFAIEASPGNFQRLERNIALNRLGNVHARQAAITAEEGPVRFSLSPAVNSGWGRIGEFASAAGVIEVPGITFDAFATAQGIDRVDLLKIDIEGHELSFLEGARESLRRGVIKRILVEYCGYSLEPKGITLAASLSAFEAHGLRPAHLCLTEIAAAKAGTYEPRRSILNLYFEHPSVAGGA